MTDKAPKKIEKWEVDSAVDTLIEAQKIMKDKRLLPKVKVAFAEKQQAMAEAALELKVAEKQCALRNKKD